MRRPWLLPLTPLYAAGLALRNYLADHGPKPQRLGAPVVSIGNLSTGGAGKTPFAIALARALAARGVRVDVLSRGYGRRDAQAARVRADGTAEEFGDEPLLIAREAGVPVYVARRRFDAGWLAEEECARPGIGSRLEMHSSGAEARNRSGGQTRGLKPPPPSVDSPGRGLKPAEASVHLLDDGFQHRQLARDVDILMMNREDWQDRLLPAGNLREPRSAVRRATVIAIPADEPELEAELKAWGWTGPVWRLRRTMEVPAVDGPVAAFCGIARPEQFFHGLEAAGLRVAARAVFRDHYRYTEWDAARMVEAARAAGAEVLVTTEKDLVRMGGLSSSFQMPIRAVHLRIEIENVDAAVDWLLARLVPALRGGKGIGRS